MQVQWTTWSRVLVAAATAVACAVLPAAASAQTGWAFADSFRVGDAEAGPGAKSVGSLVVDPGSHVLYATAGYCGTGSCTTDKTTYATWGGVSTPVDGACGAIDPAEHTMACPAVFRKAVVEYVAGEEVGTIPLGRTPAETAMDTADGTIWVTVDVASEAPALVPVKNGVVGAAVPLPFRPGALAVDPGTHAVWVLAAAGDAVLEVRDGAVGAGIPLPGGTSASSDGPTRLVVDPRTHTAYVLTPGFVFEPGSTWLTIIAPGRPARDVALAAGSVDLEVDPARGEVLVANYYAKAIAVLRDGALVDTIDAPLPKLAELAFDPAAQVGYATGRDGVVQRLVLSAAPSVRVARPTGEAAVFYGTEGPANPAPVAVFTAPMDPDSTAGAFSLSGTSASGVAFPEVAGALRWLGDTIAVFVPDRPLPLGVRFTAAVSTAAHGKDGHPLLAPHRWVFSSRAASALRAGPALSGAGGVPVTSPLYAVYSDPMDEASVEAGATLTRLGGSGAPATVPGRFAWFAPTVMVFVPDAPLAPATRYRFSAGGEALLEARGGALSPVADVTFTTAAALVTD